jgi:hypothetical protein
LEQVEIDAGALIPADDWHSVPLRMAPWFPAVRADKIRCVSDLSRGVDSMNECTRRAPQLRARLAEWPHVLGHILWLKLQCPDDDVVLVKFDVKRAFRQCSVPLRCRWKAAHTLFELDSTEGHRFVHTVLSLGATCSVDSMAEALSGLRDVLVRRHRCFIANYVDDWMLVTTRARAAALIAFILEAWELCDWPLSQSKFALEGLPSVDKDFLGVAVNTDTCVARITDARLASLVLLLDQWLTSAFSPSFKRMRSLAGTLTFVAACIPFGRVFLAALYKAAACTASAVPLSPAVRADLQWWRNALVHFTEGASFGPPPLDMPVAHVSTDAAKHGWGATHPAAASFATGTWTQAELAHSSTAVWECAAVVFAADLWGPSVSGGALVVHCDSAATVAVLSRGFARDSRMLNLLRCAVDLQLRYRFRLVLQHLPGKLNGLSDMGSRLGRLPPAYSHFRRLHPSAATRRACGQVLTLSRWQPNLAPPPVPLPSATSPTTVPSSTTTSRLMFPLTPLSFPPPVCPCVAAFST